MELEQVVVVDRPTVLDLVQSRPAGVHVSMWTPLATSRSIVRGSAPFTTVIPQSGTAEAVLAAVVVDADPNPNVRGGQFDVSAGFAARPDGSHGVLQTSVSLPVCSPPSAGPERLLRVRGPGLPGSSGPGREPRTPVCRNRAGSATMGAMTTRIAAMWQPPVLFAHRGAKAHAPDNTIEAFELAARLGRDRNGDRCLAHRRRPGRPRPRRLAPPVSPSLDRRLRPGRAPFAHPDPGRVLRGGRHRSCRSAST